MSISVDFKKFGREMMQEEKVRGVKLIAYGNDGNYWEYNSNFDPIFEKEEKK